MDSRGWRTGVETGERVGYLGRLYCTLSTADEILLDEEPLPPGACMSGQLTEKRILAVSPAQCAQLSPLRSIPEH